MNLNIIYWVLFALAIAAFYIGLRSEEYKIEYTLGALVFWGLAYWVNKMQKKQS